MAKKKDTENIPQTAQKSDQTVQEPEENKDTAMQEGTVQTTGDTPPNTVQDVPGPKENTAGDQNAAKKPEKDEEEAKEAKKPERDIFANLPNPCVYCGPTVRGVARQYTTYQGGIPDELREFIQAHPTARGLLVSTAKFAGFRKRLDTPGTAEAILFKTVKSQLK